MKNTWNSFSVSDIGRRHSINQDAIYADDVNNIWVVADGMGGHNEGEKASQAIVSFFKETKFSKVMSERVVQIETGLRALNTELKNYASSQLKGQLVGSTVAVFTVCQEVCATIWAGDSRCYKLNNNEMSQISWDHSYVGELVRSGEMTVEQASKSRRSNVITRAVGAHDELFFDHVIMPYSDGDIFLLCSDGLSNELSDKVINDDIYQLGCTQASIDNLLKKTLIYGARDNVSIILISCRQKKSFKTEESDLIESFSNELNLLANSFFTKEIELPDYYHQIANIINQSISSSLCFREKENKKFLGLSVISRSSFLFAAMVMLIVVIALLL